VTELLSHPGVFLEGAFFEVFSLLYGYHPEVTSQVIKLNKRRYKSLEEDFEDPSVLKPIRRLNVAAMPIQDAMDLAYFLAGVQIEMDRFLPGTPKCGGSVDLTVLLGTPFRDIKEFPGKLLVHPKQGAVYK
jgi:hypothetical protein